MESFARVGDILLYRKTRTLTTDAIKFGEVLEDGFEPREYYHVAVALGPYDKLEADGKSVAINPIDYGNCDVFRPPISPPRIIAALGKVRKYVGQPYDYWLILDDALRYMTRGHVHLPVAFIASKERREKICSSLVVRYFDCAEWGPKLTRNASPEDVYNAVKEWPAT